ncbi:MAG: RNA 2',3'-cyclic phosphodiesterase [Balneolaceae bacterium]|jgi:2'-5' RNA ligase
MRLFIAIPLPESAKQRLADMQQPIKGVRWQKDGNFHLTLKFLGETGSDKAQALQEKLEKLDFEPFTMVLNGLGYFPRGRKPKVLWVGVKDDKYLKDLQADIEKVCLENGFESENRPFFPHITLARLEGVRKRDIMSFINQHKKFQITKMSVNEFVLYESQLHPNGAIHTRLRTFPLKGS